MRVRLRATAGLTVVSVAVAATLRAEGPAAEILTLSAAVGRATEVSPLLAAARDRVSAAAGTVHQAGRLPNPAAEVRVESWDFHADRSTPRWDNIDFFATLTQPLELGGKRSARVAEAAAVRDAVAFEAERTRHDVILETARTYLGAIRARSLLEALEKNRESLSEIVAILGRRVAEGWTAEADLLRFRAELARAEEALLRVRLERDRELRLLAALLGEPAPVAAARLVEPALPAIPDGEADALARSTLARRPEVSRARARLAQAREAARLERARRIPSVALTAGYKRSFGLDTGVAGVSIPLPVFDLNAGNVARAEAEERAAEADLRALESRLLAGGAAQIVAARELRARALSVEQDLVGPAEGARDAASAAFREGASDVLRLVDARRLYLDARREALDLTAEAILSAAEVRLLLGEEAIP
jgi:cobalt-zinc-cadmium efflux system outer membrane protein